MNLVRHAIEAPVRQIADNAGLEGAIVAEKVKEAGDGIGYNAAEDKYEDMLKSGIVGKGHQKRTAECSFHRSSGTHHRSYRR